MAGREQFENELNEVKQKVIALLKASQEQLNRSVKALYASDIDESKQLIEDDKALDELDLAINESAILLIAKQQPVATDLRKLIAAIRLATDIERMADNAKNIARSAIHLGPDHHLTIDPRLTDMAKIANAMIDLAIEAYNEEDIHKAKQLSDEDDKIDELFGKVLKDMLSNSANRSVEIQLIMQVAFCARYIERFGDHLTNVAENIMYLVKGETFDLNR
ncbi:PhoU-like phosphate uptake regulator [Streptohalobacillus salinus]|uniref:Phosphate-specific transport system accessory protein PhoU n=1 Tax=Streptohalobacillus salinus TaxID=621096 RepID=A0A2V3W6K2_9BACI|nr:phosphate signaling complex protein PhoU [Streptohalobacillus salinus]PXW89993.1 PhoU-like phosphate uptake regulator [Streptohalobacillus salinus]